jgi:hypothetical protein
LAPEEVELYFRLSIALLLDANRRLRVLPRVDAREDFMRASLDAKIKLRDALYGHPELIDAFVADNPEGFSPPELAAVSGWKRCVRGSFYILRFLKRYAVFLDSGTPARAYGVLGLHDEIDQMFPGLRPPVYVRAVLLRSTGGSSMTGSSRRWPFPLDRAFAPASTRRTGRRGRPTASSRRWTPSPSLSRPAGLGPRSDGDCPA